MPTLQADCTAGWPSRCRTALPVLAAAARPPPDPEEPDLRMSSKKDSCAFLSESIRLASLSIR